MGAELPGSGNLSSPEDALRRLQQSVREDERDLAWKVKRIGMVRTAAVVVALCIPGLVAWNAIFSDQHQWRVTGQAVLVMPLVLSILFLLITGYVHLWKTDRLGEFFAPFVEQVEDRYGLSTSELRDRLELNQAAFRRWSSLAQAPLKERRSLYREDVAEIIAKYQAESRKYRRVHNSLQSLVMAGSTTVTTVAALDTREWNWQTIVVIAVGFCVALASTFTGYFKYRERSYFLQQTADAIEEEANAHALGVGQYSRFTAGQEDQALAQFTQEVEKLRNEQRRRQQQLDQPTEQAVPQGPSGTA
ncbi:DUF4231 domain-containing protein [Streptomyces axinellae]